MHTINTESKMATDEVFIIGVDEPVPFPQGYRTTIDRTKCEILGGRIYLLAGWPDPTQEDVECFRHLTEYRLYRSSNFPYGVTIWNFSSELWFETVFDPSIEPDDKISGFIASPSNILTAVMIDRNDICRSLGTSGLDWDYFNCLISIWQDPKINWDGVVDDYIKLCSDKTTAELWEDADWRWRMDE